MDENRNGCFWCKHPICKSIFIALLVFFGAFAAFYVVTDWHFKRMLDPSVQMRKVEKMMMNTQMLTKDLGTILVGQQAVDEGVINAVGGISDAFAKLYELIDQKRT